MTYSIFTISPICHNLKAKGYKLVLATGFFDLLHQEHLNFLVKAKAAGDILIVGVESDKRAREVKGEGRPIETQNIRCTKVLQCEGGNIVDYVIALPDDFDHYEAYDSLMATVQPDIYAVSSHTDHLKSKTFLAEKYGGELIVVHPHNSRVSTTIIVNSKKQL